MAAKMGRCKSSPHSSPTSLVIQRRQAEQIRADVYDAVHQVMVKSALGEFKTQRSTLPFINRLLALQREAAQAGNMALVSEITTRLNSVAEADPDVKGALQYIATQTSTNVTNNFQMEGVPSASIINRPVRLTEAITGTYSIEQKLRTILIDLPTLLGDQGATLAQQMQNIAPPEELVSALFLANNAQRTTIEQTIQRAWDALLALANVPEGTDAKVQRNAALTALQNLINGLPTTMQQTHKPDLPDGLTVRNWRVFNDPQNRNRGSIEYPHEGELKVGGKIYTLHPNRATIHAWEELSNGNNWPPSKFKISAYLKSFCDAAVKAAQSARKAGEGHEVADVPGTDWKIGVNVYDKRKQQTTGYAGEINHADSGYHRSPWRNRPD